MYLRVGNSVSRDLAICGKTFFSTRGTCPGHGEWDQNPVFIPGHMHNEKSSDKGMACNFLIDSDSRIRG